MSLISLQAKSAISEGFFREYRINPLVDLHWRLLGDDWVLFESLSGQTHQINEVVAAIILSFDSGQSLSLHALTSKLQDDFNLALIENQTVDILLFINQLMSIGLMISTDAHAAR